MKKKKNKKLKNSSSYNSFTGIIFITSFVVITLFIFFIVQQKQEVKKKAFAAFTTEFGFNFAPQFTVPTLAQYQMLNPQWVRFGVILGATYPMVPASVKKLVLFNNEETTGFPQGSTDLQAWKTYTDSQYIPAIQSFLAQHADTNAIEVWNEEDLCPNGSCVPAQAYAYILKSAARTIKASNSNIQVVMGGLASGNTQYIQDVKNTDPTVFDQVDGVGFHPYGKSPGGWCASGCTGGTLPFGDLASAIRDYNQTSGLPVWITEVGTNTTDQNWQAEYLQRVFTVFQQSGVVPMAIWYSFNDGDGSWGLVDTTGKIKADGTTFLSFNNQPTPGANGIGNPPITVIPTFFCMGLGSACVSNTPQKATPAASPSITPQKNATSSNPAIPITVGVSSLGIIGLLAFFYSKKK